MTSSDSSFEEHILREPGDTPRSDSTDSTDSNDSENLLSISSLPLPPLDTISPLCSPLPEPTTSQTGVSPTSPGISQAFTSLGLSPAPQEPDFIFPEVRGPGRPRKKRFCGNQFTARKPIPTDVQDSITALCPKHPKARSRKYFKVLPRRGYIAKFRIPPKTRSTSVLLRSAQGESERDAHIPTGMRILDVGILAEVFSSFPCSECIGTLSLYEESWAHGWQTFFRVKCDRCHKEHATFPSSRSLDIPSHHTCVNVPFTTRDMNEVTMRSVMAVHSTGMSWRSLHKISTVFDMPPPLQSMPSRYTNRLEAVTTTAVATAMSDAAKQLHQRVDCEPSPQLNAINVTISFDSSWKTRGYYSNMGFGAVISTDTKKLLDYEIMSRLCEKCSVWTEEKQKDRPAEYEKWLERHKPNCNRNHTGSPQSMEPEAAKRIWGRSLEKNRLVYSVFVGDGDSKSFQQLTELNPYPLVKIRKEECLTHAVKRLKRALTKKKRSTKNHTYLQHKLTDWKADYLASNYSTVIYQHRGTTATKLCSGLHLLLDHVAGNHSGCPTGEKSWCRWRNPSTSSAPTALTTFKPIDIEKVKEVFNTYATVEFCSHLTLGLTQNANESLHNTIWCLCPKSKYVSPQSIRISTAIAVLTFNEGELALFGILTDLGLFPSWRSYNSILKREYWSDYFRCNQKKAHFQRRRRRARLFKQQREKALLKAEGGSSYKGGRFGAEIVPEKKKRGRARGRAGLTGRGRSGVKRRVRERSISPVSMQSSSDSSSSSDESDTLCSICHQREPEPIAKRKVGRKNQSEWVCCDNCDEWVHCYCADVDFESASAATFCCDKCS